MSFSPEESIEDNVEMKISDICLSLDNQFINMQELSKAEGMRVYARVRPMLDREIEAGYKECIAAIDEQTVRALVPASSAKYKSTSHANQDIIEDFTFTHAFGPETGQFVFFQECMMNTMQNFIEGQNSLVFSYGSTGSGKTFTLQGKPDNPGVIPLSLHLFFATIENQLLDNIMVKPDKFSDVIILSESEKKKELNLKEELLSSNEHQEWNTRSSASKSFLTELCEDFSEKSVISERQTTLLPDEMAQAQAATLMKEMSKKSAENMPGHCSVWISFAEIYNEYVFDLLQPNIKDRAKLNLGEDKNGDVYVKGLREVCVSNCYEALQLLSIGQRNLRIASTRLNYQSSRSHCIYTIKVIRVPDTENITYAKVNRLSFCDLAGSERASKAQTTGMRLKEAGCINTSLHVLGKCLEQLRMNPHLRDKKLIPFRESKLTRMFSGFFIGKGKAVMIANASPSELTFDETLHVLRFSAVAKELIINDSYIATASSTLQTITNMLTNAKGNASLTSDKSISFEDSVEESEKDEIIEKLLDLAESLRNNLEREKKEKAELEIKLRQEIYDEYATYSDELLENQRRRLESEREEMIDIYKKRISEMQKKHQKTIDDLRNLSDDSDLSGLDADESMDDGCIERSAKKETKVILKEAVENSSNSMCCTHLQEIEQLKKDLAMLMEQYDSAKSEVEKAVQHATELEKVTIDLESKVEISKQNLDNAMDENEKLKQQNEFLHSSYQQEIMSLESEKITLEEQKKAEADNGYLQKCKTELEDKVKVLSEQIANLQNEIKEKSHVLERLKLDIVVRDDQLQRLQEANTELTESGIQAKLTFEAEIRKVTEELEQVKSKSQDLELTVSLLEKEKEANGLNIEAMSKQLDDAKCTITDLQDKLTTVERKACALYKTISDLNSEISEHNIQNLTDKEKYQSALKKLEKEAKDTKEELEIANKSLADMTQTAEEQNNKISLLETESAVLKKDFDLLEKSKKGLEERYSKLTKELVSEIQRNHQTDKVSCEVAEHNILKEQLEAAQINLNNYLATIYAQKVKIEAMQQETSTFDALSASWKESEANYKEQISKLQSDFDTNKELLEESQLNLRNSSEIIEAVKTDENNFKEQVSCLKNEPALLTAELAFSKNQMELALKNMEDSDKSNNELKTQLIEMLNAKNELEEMLNSQSETEREQLHRMINILQRCEMEATEKRKELHCASIKHVEEVMDLKKSLKDASENLRNESNNLQRKLKDMQASSKKQIQALKQQHSTEIETVKNQVKSAEKKITELKSKLSEVEKLKDVLQKEKKALEKDLNNVKKDNDELEKQKDALTKERDVLEREKNTLEEEKSALEKEIKTLEKGKRTLEKEMKTLEEGKSTLEKENASEKFAKPFEKLEKGILGKENNLKNEKPTVEKVRNSKRSKRNNLEKEKITPEEVSNEKNNLSKEFLVTKELKVLLTKENICVTEKMQEIDNIIRSAEKEHKSSENNIEAEKTSKSTLRPKRAKSQRNPTVSNKKTSSSVVSSSIKENLDQENHQKVTEKNALIEIVDITDSSKENIGKSAKSKTPAHQNANKKVPFEVVKENTNEATKVPRRQLKNLGNVAETLGLTPQKVSSFSSNKSLKRKEQEISPDEKFLGKESLKKTKFYNESDCKPVSLRVQVLTGKIMKEVVSPKPSPRLTRGRKRITNCELFQNKENVSTTKRSVRY